jgi:uncharacterized protein involved in exopolysaccharide biosynthesis
MTNRSDEQATSGRGPRGTPEGYFLLVQELGGTDGPSLSDLTGALLGGWRIILLAGALGAVVAGAGSLLIPDRFRSEALVIAVEDDSGAALGSLASRFGGLAGLAGIDLSGSGSQKDTALALLRSRGFLEDFITDNGLLPVLFADDWDAAAKSWNGGADAAPSIHDAYLTFSEDVLRVSEDRQSGIISVRIEWTTPDLAAVWANQLVDRVNDRLRARAVEEAEKSVAYLLETAAETDVVEARQAIFGLVESQVNRAMIAKIRPEFALQYVDRARPADPELQSSPNRALIVMLSSILAGMIGALVVLFRVGRSRR